MAVGKVTDATFESEVLQAKGTVIVDFWAEWCGPCKQIAPVLDELSGKLGDKVKIVKIDVSENEKIAQQYRITSIPTLLMFKNGELSSQQIGFGGKPKLEQWITSSV